jgi:hypothetical protein
MKARKIYSVLNMAAFIVGVYIVWSETHNAMAVLGCWIAALHFSNTIEL